MKHKLSLLYENRFEHPFETLQDITFSPVDFFFREYMNIFAKYLNGHYSIIQFASFSVRMYSKNTFRLKNFKVIDLLIALSPYEVLTNPLFPLILRTINLKVVEISQPLHIL